MKDFQYFYIYQPLDKKSTLHSSLHIVAFAERCFLCVGVATSSPSSSRSSASLISVDGALSWLFLSSLPLVVEVLPHRTEATTCQCFDLPYHDRRNTEHASYLLFEIARVSRLLVKDK